MNDENKTGKAVLVGFGAVGLCSLAMWGLSKANESRVGAFGLAPEFRNASAPPTKRSPVFEEVWPLTSRAEELLMSEPYPTERMPPTSNAHTIRDLLHEFNPPTTLRRRY